MKIHEYQAKEILARYGVPIPRSQMVETVEAAVAAARALGGEAWLVKAQIHAGGRGKGGGVKLSQGLDALRSNAEAILGMQLVTHQTGPAGQKVRKILIEEGMEVRSELYLSLVVDRDSRAVVVLASTEGGMEIEEVAAKTPEKILQETVDPAVGLKRYQALRLAQRMGLGKDGPKLARAAASVIGQMYETFVAEDCSLVEINPLVVTGDGRIVALDAKINIEDNALFRHQELNALRDPHEEDPLETQAAAADLNYIKLDGTIGCLVNGAGLAMGTMDLIKAVGRNPANFLDIGGGADQERVETAFRIITADPNVKGILVNIFGGIVRCDVVAKGIVAAFKSVGVTVPVVVRLEGTNAQEAREIINGSDLGDKLVMVSGLTEAAQMSVTAAG